MDPQLRGKTSSQPAAADRSGASSRAPHGSAAGAVDAVPLQLPARREMGEPWDRPDGWGQEGEPPRCPFCGVLGALDGVGTGRDAGRQFRGSTAGAQREGISQP
jgi:hypothetical protein